MKRWFNKTFLLSVIANGGTFATIMAIFDFTDKKPFDVSQFLFYFLFVGFFMATVFAWKNKKDASN
ncbi:hypothetical protein ABN763_08365 [Spongiivirga sp. MCCC 1A20706]|uniref:hypothetical protein n=1 Tax=Spongiivirga sp. MCCC 1A20706 TaxID=3160963 RepID=UPI003977D52A